MHQAAQHYARQGRHLAASLRASLSVSAALLAAACAGTTEPAGKRPGPLTELPRALSVAEQKVLGAGNEFTFALFRAVTEAQRGKNVFVSPLSASMALGMTMNGAAGPTFDQMRTALSFGSASQEEINEGYKGSIALLRGLDGSVDFRLANSIWYRRDFPFTPSFLDAARTWFDAEVRGLDFTQPAAALGAVNGWVNQSTGGKIPTIIDEIRDDQVMFLINAIYFKGKWRERFDPAETRDAQFHGAGGQQPMKLMHRHGKMAYLRTPQFQAVDLPYGRGAFAMTVLLPTEGTDVESLATSLRRDTWATWTEQFREVQMDLYLPRLKLEYERKLNDDLEALSMRDAFVPDGADFTRMAPAPIGHHLYIDFVKQKTFVDVNEEGTEAAAATAVGVGFTSLPPTMRVDRPYLFAIRERLSGTILFIGKIVSMPS
ncbi:MAG: serpin family protein [Gemmatimonadaceae bacterium]